jgi:hypothetical protein
MRNAYEYREEFTQDGKGLVRREVAIGPIVPWTIVVLATLFLSRGSWHLPLGIWELLGWKC